MNEYTGYIARRDGKVLYFENKHMRPRYGYVIRDSIEAVHDDEVFTNNGLRPACRILLRSGRGIIVEVAASRVLDCL